MSSPKVWRQYGIWIPDNKRTYPWQSWNGTWSATGPQVGIRQEVNTMPDKTPAARLLVIGADHKSSTMMVRDRLFMRESALPAFYDRLRSVGFSEAMVISTHDRTDVLVLDGGIPDAAEEIRRLLAAHAGVARNEIASETY